NFYAFADACGNSELGLRSLLHRLCGEINASMKWASERKHNRKDAIAIKEEPIDEKSSGEVNHDIDTGKGITMELDKVHPVEETEKKKKKRRKGPTPCQFTCGVCGRKYSAKAGLKTHQRTHLENEEERLPFKCEECGKRFCQSGVLKKHKMSHFSDEVKLQFKCDICDKTFTLPENLETHKNKHLSDNDPLKKKFECRKCKKEYSEASALNSHWKRV
ncbi:hypothetical protein PMAYCL1PPCAC_08020, partial [Pristionchus mayeri]